MYTFIYLCTVFRTSTNFQVISFSHVFSPQHLWRIEHTNLTVLLVLVIFIHIQYVHTPLRALSLSPPTIHSHVHGTHSLVRFLKVRTIFLILIVMATGVSTLHNRMLFWFSKVNKNYENKYALSLYTKRREAYLSLSHELNMFSEKSSESVLLSEGNGKADGRQYISIVYCIGGWAAKYIP